MSDGFFSGLTNILPDWMGGTTSNDPNAAAVGLNAAMGMPGAAASTPAQDASALAALPPSNLTQLAGALKGLQGQAGGNTAAGQSQTPQGVAAGSAQSTLGQPLHRVDPNSVLDVLHRRALGLQQGAMAGPRGKGWGDVQTPVPTSYGLLGF